MQSDLVIDAAGANPVLGAYRIVDERDQSNAYDVWSEFLCVTPSPTPRLSTCVFGAIAEPPDDWFDDDGEPLPHRSLDGTLFPPAFFEGDPVGLVESFVCGPLVVSPGGDETALASAQESEVVQTLEGLGWPADPPLVSRILGALASQQTSQLSSDLLRAYLSTRYVVDHSGSSFELRIGEKCDALLPHLAGREAGGAAFLTAWNPEGQQLDDQMNRHRNCLLKADLESIATTVLAGRGIGRDETWPPEESFLGIGLSFEQAIHVGRHYAQNAIVWAAQDCVPKLVLLR